METKIEHDQSFVASTIQKIWNQIYPPLPPNIAERKKMVTGDFIVCLILVWPVTLLGYIGSKYQLMWKRLYFNWYLTFRDKSTGEDGDMIVTETSFDGVPVRVYDPKNRQGDGGVIYMHGGGFVMCSIRSHDYTARSIAKKTGLLLISIDYRLAPEHKYPAAVVDCERAIVHFLTKAYETYNVNPQKVVIMGNSAGGNSTAVVTQRLRELDVPQPKLQVLICPWVQMVNMKLPSYQVEKRSERTSMLTPSMMARFTLHYLIGEDIGHYVQDFLSNKHITPELWHSPSFDRLKWSNVPREYAYPDSALFEKQAVSEPNAVNAELNNLLKPYLLDANISPLLHPDLAGLPAAMVITVDIDPLRDEGIMYAERLHKSGVKVVHKHYPNGYHAAISAPGMKVGIEIIEDIGIFIGEYLQFDR